MQQAYPSTQTVVAPPLVKGDEWRVVVQSFDGTAYGSTVSASIVIPFDDVACTCVVA